MSLSKQAIPVSCSWTRCVLGLQYLKSGLEGVTERIIYEQHELFLKGLPNIAGNCKSCSFDKLLPDHKRNAKKCPYKNKNCLCLKSAGRTTCCNGFCSKLFDLIVKEHKYKDPNWKNTELTQWKTCPWEVAACYINTCGCKGKTGETMDSAALLSIIINNTAFENNLGGIIIEECKKVLSFINDVYGLMIYLLLSSTLAIDPYISYFKLICNYL